jgi:alanyl-tRNA synthetase
LVTSNQIRDSFLKYFETNGHKIVSSSSLIPFKDPTLLFTNAGMNQFKDVFTGNETRSYKRATTSQKCMRVSGKHNDFKDVGHSPRHHTFFEMLGNFSFGDYFKKDAIHYSWELVTKGFGLDPAKLWITVYQEDQEAWDIWHNQEGIPSEKIFRLGEKDNFWAMGDTGPCGPCSELHYDFGGSPLEGHGDCDLTCSCGRWVEIWNLVFMQFNRDASGSMFPLPSPSIDTGMGFERITAILQGKTSNYDTDLFRPLLEEIESIANIQYGANENDDVSARIIADHSRAAAFVIADGQYPGNDKRGYVLRKIMRRAVVHGKKLKIEEPFIYRVAGTVIETMKSAYPELIPLRESVARAVKQEEESFADTLSQGLRDFYDRVKRIKASGSRAFSGKEAFFLYDTRGLPLEILEDLAQESGLVIDEEEFVNALRDQQERSRQDYKTGKIRAEVAHTLFEGKTSFVGYNYQSPVTAVLQAIVVDGERSEVIEQGQRGEIILDRTPFYAEAGGQVGDTGFMSKESARARVVDTIYRGNTISHVVEMETGSLQVGDTITAAINSDRRLMTMKNHTATHLLQAALQKVLGPHVKQAGSLVSPDHLRFDFMHFAPMTPAEIQIVEDDVNSEIQSNIKVAIQEMDLDEAIKTGAMALFGEKYQDTVRLVSVPGYSKELCGGTHVSATGDIGVFKIVYEGGIAAGVRRLEALTGPAALNRFRTDEQILDFMQSQYKVTRQQIPSWLEKMQNQIRDLQDQIDHLRLKSAKAGLSEMLEHAREIHGIRVVAHALPQTDRASLRAVADELKQKLVSGIVILGTPQDDKVALVVMVSEDLSQRIPAGKIIKQIAALVGGTGGGKPQLAEAGGKDSAKLADAIESSYSIVESILVS